MKITPVIKKTRIIKEEYEICPHCNQEIREKSLYIDANNMVYHRPCKEKEPIDKIKPLSKQEFNFLGVNYDRIRDGIKEIANSNLTTNHLEKKLSKNIAKKMQKIEKAPAG